MKTAFIVRLFTALLLLAAVCTVQAQSTAFTYQGRLSDNGAPANGLYDLQFALRDAVSIGNSVGSAITVAPVAVTNGLFTVTLDFGAGVFTGAARWLEIGVRTNGSAAAYIALSPRQAVTSTPYAITAGNVTGTLTAGQIPSLDAAKIASGTLDANRIPSLDAGKIVTGTVSDARLSTAIARSVTVATDLSSLSNALGLRLVATNDAIAALVSAETAARQAAIAAEQAARAAAIAQEQADRAAAVVALLAANSVFTGSNTFSGPNFFTASNHYSGVVVATNALNSLHGSFTGNGAGLTNLPPASITGTLATGQIPSLDAAKIASGTLAVERIPALDAAQVTSGTFTASQVPNLDAAQVTTGTLDANRIPNLDAIKVTTGTLDTNRIPSLDGGKITTGAIADARLSANVALLNGTNTFTGTNSFTGGNVGIGTTSPIEKLHVEGNILGGTPAFTVSSKNGFDNIAGSGSGLGGAGGTLALLSGSAGISAGAGGTRPSGGDIVLQTGLSGTGGLFAPGNDGAIRLLTGIDERLRISPNGNVGIGTTTPGSKLEVSGTVTATSYSGSGAGLTDVVAANLTGTIADARLSANVAFLSGTNVFTGTNNFSGSVVLTNANNQVVGVFSGDGAGLTNLSVPVASLVGTLTAGHIPLLDATKVATGTIDDTRLSANVALLNSSPTFTGTIGASGFTGSGSGLVNVPGTLVWQTVLGQAQQAVANTGYLVTNNEAQVTITLPIAPKIGDVVRVSSGGVGGWRIAQNAGQLVLDPFPSWTAQAGSPSMSWRSVASSADGNKLVAVVSGGQIYTSIDSAASWTPRESSRYWQSVASSADGSKLVAVVSGGQIYTSPDSGVSWTAQAGSPSTNWTSVASSADGNKLVAVVSGGQIYTSPDSGVSWTAHESSRNWWAVASSADGSKLVAVVSGGQIYTSTDSGVSWTPHESSRGWWAVASSADGSKLVAMVGGGYVGQIYTSTDSGETWTAHESSRYWFAVASSADGSKLVAMVESGLLYTSTDSGVTWTTPDAITRPWRSVASSADGNKLVAVAQGLQILTRYPNSTPGTGGYLIGGQFTAIELQYIGNNQFLLRSHEGTILVY